jgi:hypothetical protein
VHQAYIKKETQENNSQKRGGKVTNMRQQGRIKLKRGIDDSMRPRKVTSKINLVNQQNPKMNKAKS